MTRSYLPFIFVPSNAAARVLGHNWNEAAVLALRAILKHHKSLEVAHQQIRYREHHLAFSSRITAGGELVVELDIGDARLEERLILEDELRAAGRKVKARGISEGRRRSS